jgi:hypothetical protein
MSRETESRHHGDDGRFRRENVRVSCTIHSVDEQDSLWRLTDIRVLKAEDFHSSVQKKGRAPSDPAFEPCT